MLVELRAVEAFLFREARLMDTHSYDEWLTLWSEDAWYWVPANADDIDPARHISLVNENRAGIEDRIARLKSGAHYAQEPNSRLSRVVGNIELAALEGELLSVHSTFNITASRKGRIDIFAGRTLHQLRVQGDEWRIVHKRILLVNNDEVINNLTFLI
jgi:3-phenylpropionate/cinnamic acid dioxygenase small subunit